MTYPFILSVHLIMHPRILVLVGQLVFHLGQEKMIHNSIDCAEQSLAPEHILSAREKDIIRSVCGMQGEGLQWQPQRFADSETANLAPSISPFTFPSSPRFVLCRDRLLVCNRQSLKVPQSNVAQSLCRLFIPAAWASLRIGERLLSRAERHLCLPARRMDLHVQMSSARSRSEMTVNRIAQ